MPTPPPLDILGKAMFPDATGEGPMTNRQAVILREFSERTGEPFDAALTEAQAAKRIAALKEIAEDRNEQPDDDENRDPGEPGD